MKTISAVSILVFAMLTTAQASGDSPRAVSDDREAIHTVIRSQLSAFLADDAAGAYSLTSPALQRYFSNPELFLEMIKLAYPAVYRPRAFHFDALEVSNGKAAQSVVILGEGEFALLAVFELQQQSDGRWLISACDLYASGSRVI